MPAPKKKIAKKGKRQKVVISPQSKVKLQASLGIALFSTFTIILVGLALNEKQQLTWWSEDSPQETPATKTQPKLVINEQAKRENWKSTQKSIAGQTTKVFTFKDDNESALFIGSPYALSGEIDICGGEPPCVDYGTFEVRIGNNAYTTPIFVSRNRQSGVNKYIFQFRAYGYEDAPYISAKILSPELIPEINSMLSTMISSE